MKRRKRKVDKGAPKWLVTYSDMVTLILVFFILLFSMSQIDQVKFDAVAESFQNRMVLDFLPSIVPNTQPADNSNAEAGGESDSSDPINVDVDREEYVSKQQEEQSLNELVENVESYLDENELNAVITANRTEQGVVLVLQDSIFFDMGEAQILEEGEPFLSEIGALISQIPNDLKVEGHTDSRPINSFRYPSNWELSGARASSVVRFFVNEFALDQSRFSIAGYGDTRQVAPNDSPENMSKNRRVEITIMNMEHEEE